MLAGGAVLLHGIVNIEGEEEELEHDRKAKELENC
jgi:hypothetical protein